MDVSGKLWINTFFYLVVVFQLAACDMSETDPDAAPLPAAPFKHVDFERPSPGSVYDLNAVVDDFGIQPIYVQRGLPRGPHGVLDSIDVSFFGLELKYNPISMGLRAQIVDGEQAGGDCGNAVRIHYPQGQVRRGVGWYWNLARRPITSAVGSPVTTINKSGGKPDVHFFYRVRFEDDFNFVQTGKLAGLAGGLANTGGLTPNGSDGWSARIIWNRIPSDAPDVARAGIYLYHPDQPEQYGQAIPLFANAPPMTLQPQSRELLVAETGEPANLGTFDQVFFEAGPWYNIEMRVKVNTPGGRDGLVQIWLNDQPVMDLNGIQFRNETVSEEVLRVKWGLFDTIFGGNTDDYAPVKDEYAYFDDFIVSTTYIGSAYADFLCSDQARTGWVSSGLRDGL